MYFCVDKLIFDFLFIHKNRHIQLIPEPASDLSFVAKFRNCERFVCRQADG